MTLVYVIAAVIAFATYLVMGGYDMRLRWCISVGLFICLVALATWIIVRVGDEARPGSTEVKSVVPGQDDHAPGSR